MLIFDMQTIGARLLALRKKIGLTQSEVAERARLSDRTYADIERGSVNMRVETLLKICQAFGVTPDEILTEEKSTPVSPEELALLLSACSASERRTALALLGVYLESLH